MKKLCALILAAACLSACDAPSPPPAASVSAPLFHAEALVDPQYGRDFRLTDHNGQTRTLADWRGKVVLIFFGYTQCPDVCPSALYRSAQVMERLGSQAEKVQMLFITLDPARDTPELLRTYVPSFHPSFLGLFASEEQTPQLARDFQVFYRINPGQTPGSYTVDHSVTTYAYDPAGRLRLAIRHDITPEELAEDIQRLLTEAAVSEPSGATAPPHGA
ncbi:MAG: SCO family protein [Zoogloeaceae bacterium]|jgi:protein SCO1/2|nr:SCO family protein [Zoogloeaceae bacterium]